MDGMTAIEEFVNTLKEPQEDFTTTYSGVVSRVDSEGTVWVYMAGSDKETPTASASSEIKRGDFVNLEWRNNKLYIVGNTTNPSAGVQRVVVVEKTADTALSTADSALNDATIAREAAASAVQSAATAGRAASIAQSAAETAQATADIKKRVFTSQPVPPYNVGDLWVDLGSADFDLVTSAGDVLVDDQANALVAAVLGTGSETVVYVSTFARTAEESYMESDWTLAATDDAKVDELREWFWHDALGAHVLGDATGFRNDITSTGMQIIDTSTETSVATFGASGAQIGQDGAAHSIIDADGQRVYASDGSTQIANIGYGDVVTQGGTGDAPYYTLGRRGSGNIGEYSFEEGDGNVASAPFSHAEGTATYATGVMSHAEGNGSTASGSVSHAEGAQTTASGSASHAQNTGTTAQRKSQTAIGEYNELDTTGTTSTRGKYALIIGNGTADNSRSNALTVDWNGNVDASGGLTLNGTEEVVDYVIDEDTRGNWRYRKWHSGKIEAWFEGTFSCEASTTARGALYYSTWSLNIPSEIGFTATPNTLIGNTGDSTTVIAVNGAATSATAMSGNVWRYASSSSALSITARIYAWQN